MAAPINPGSLPAVTGPKPSDLVRNATQIGMAQSTAREVKQDQVDASSVSASPPPSASQPALGVTLKPEGDGTALSTTDSGLQVNFSDKHQHLTLPNGDQIMHSFDDGQLMGMAGGQPVKVKPFQDDSGAVYGYTYTRPDGTQVSVNLQDWSYSLQNKAGTLRQTVDPQGGSFIQMASDYRNDQGKIESLQQNVFVSPDGQVEGLGKNQQGLQVNGRQVSFVNPSGLRVSADIPQPMSGPLSGDVAAPPPAQPTPTAPPINFKPGNPVLMDNSTPVPSNPPPGGGIYAPPPGGIYAPPPGDGITNTPSGVSRVRQPDMGLTTLILPSGNTMMDLKGDARVTNADGTDGGPVEVTPHQRPNAPPESRYRFCDGQGNRFTMYSDSLDFMVEGNTGHTVEVVMPDGTVYGAIKGDTGVKRFQIGPGDHVAHDPGIDVGYNRITGSWDRVHIPGDAQPCVSLPYPVDAHHRYDNITPGSGANYPTSGEIPPLLQGGGPIGGGSANPGNPNGPPGPPNGPSGPPNGPFGSPNSQFGPPNGQFGGPNNNQFGPPNSQFGGPNNQFGPPNGQFGGPNNQFGPPNGQFGGPNNQFGPPNGQFGGPNNQFGRPNGQFGPPNNQSGGPNSQFGPPFSTSGAPPQQLSSELAQLQAEKAQNPAAFSPQKQARMDELSRLLQNPGSDPGQPWQQPIRPSFMQRLKHLFTGQPGGLQPGYGPQYQYPMCGQSYPQAGAPPMANQCGGYPNQGYGCSCGNDPWASGSDYNGDPGGLPFHAFLAQQAGQTAMMGNWAMMSSMPFMPFGMGQWGIFGMMSPMSFMNPYMLMM